MENRKRKLIKKLLIFLMLSLLISCQTFHKKKHVDFTEENLSKFQSTKLKINQNPDIGRLIYRSTEITIQGRKLNLVIDTGDEVDMLLIDNDVLNTLNYEETNKSIKLLASFVETEIEIVTIPDIQIGDLYISSLECSRLHEGHPYKQANHSYDNESLGFDGMIGWNLLKNFNILFDAKNNSLELYNPEIIPEGIKNWSKLKMNRDTTPSLKLTLKNGEKVNMILETGAGKRTPATGKVWNWFFYEKRMVLNDLNMDFLEDEELGLYTCTTSFKIDDNLKIEEDFYFKKGPDALQKNYDGCLTWGFFDNYQVFVDNNKGYVYITLESLPTYNEGLCSTLDE